MYLQITNRCNMDCMHCGYSCGKHGRHMSLATVKKAIKRMKRLDRKYGEENAICIGGGEPTLHPDFFEILKLCMDKFSYVWMATNGSQKATMLRLHAIIRHMDAEYFDNWRDRNIIRNKKSNLVVCLSLDKWHSDIDEDIKMLWRSQSNYNHEHRHCYELRDVGYMLSNQGRAKYYSIGTKDHKCICDALFFKANGNIHICGCEHSPIVGTIDEGFNSYWNKARDLMDDELDGALGTCYKTIKKNHPKFFTWLRKKDKEFRVWGDIYGRRGATKRT